MFTKTLTVPLIEMSMCLSNDALQTMQKMAGRSALDGDLVSLIALKYEKINAMRAASQTEGTAEYREFAAALA